MTGTTRSTQPRKSGLESSFSAMNLTVLANLGSWVARRFRLSVYLGQRFLDFEVQKNHLVKCRFLGLSTRILVGGALESTSFSVILMQGSSSTCWKPTILPEFSFFFNGEDHLEHRWNVVYSPFPGHPDSLGLGWGGRTFYELGRLLLSIGWEHCSGDYLMHSRYSNLRHWFSYLDAQWNYWGIFKIDWCQSQWGAA